MTERKQKLWTIVFLMRKKQFRDEDFAWVGGGNFFLPAIHPITQYTGNSLVTHTGSEVGLFFKLLTKNTFDPDK